MILKPFDEIIAMTITNHRDIGKGRVVPFPSKEVYYLPAWLAQLTPFKYTVPDNSFLHEGMMSGAVLVARASFDHSEVTSGRLSIVRINGADFVNRVFLLPNGTIRLNAGHKDSVYPAAAVEILGLVELEIIKRN